MKESNSQQWFWRPLLYHLTNPLFEINDIVPYVNNLFNYLFLCNNKIGDNMKITILGTGAYGMAISSILIDNGMDVTMWTKFEDEKDSLIKNRQNEKLLYIYRQYLR